MSDFSVTETGLFKQDVSNTDCLAIATVNGVVSALGYQHRSVDLKGAEPLIKRNVSNPEDPNAKSRIQQFVENHGLHLRPLSDELKGAAQSSLDECIDNLIESAKEGSVLVSISQKLARKPNILTSKLHRVVLTRNQDNIEVIDSLEPNTRLTLPVTDRDSIAGFLFSATLNSSVSAGVVSGKNMQERAGEFKKAYQQFKTKLAEPNNYSYALHTADPSIISSQK